MVREEVEGRGEGVGRYIEACSHPQERVPVMLEGGEGDQHSLSVVLVLIGDSLGEQ